MKKTLLSALLFSSSFLHCLRADAEEMAYQCDENVICNESFFCPPCPWVANYFCLERIYAEAGYMNFFKVSRFRYGSLFTGTTYNSPAINDSKSLTGPYIEGGMQFRVFETTPGCDCLHFGMGVSFYNSRRSLLQSALSPEDRVFVSAILNNPTATVNAIFPADTNFTNVFDRKWREIAGYFEAWNGCGFRLHGYTICLEPIARVKFGQLKENDDFSFFRANGTTFFYLSDTIRSNFVNLGGGLKIIAPLLKGIDFFAKGIVYFGSNFVDYRGKQFFDAPIFPPAILLQMQKYLFGVNFDGETGVTLQARCVDISFVAGYEYWGNQPQIAYTEVFNTDGTQTSGKTRIESTSYSNYKLTGRVGLNF